MLPNVKAILFQKKTKRKHKTSTFLGVGGAEEQDGVHGTVKVLPCHEINRTGNIVEKFDVVCVLDKNVKGFFLAGKSMWT